MITCQGLVFRAPIDNEWFAGYVDHRDIADRIARCAGDSGANTDYIVNLWKALATMNVDDAHVSHIVRHLADECGTINMP